jgi:hypothetical protein
MVGLQDAVGGTGEALPGPIIADTAAGVTGDARQVQGAVKDKLEQAQEHIGVGWIGSVIVAFIGAVALIGVLCGVAARRARRRRRVSRRWPRLLRAALRG